MTAVESPFSDRGKRWLLVTGGALGASSGVPLPFERTRWSPSLDDIVRHHLFRQHSRRIFESVEQVGERQPPLGFVGDTLEAQQQWLAGYLQGLEPHVPLIRTADLAADGMFQAVVTDAPDRLLHAALDRLGVDYREVSLDSPTTGDGASLAIVREWDDRIFSDSENRRARERRFLQSRLEEWLAAVDAVLVLGHAGHECDLTDTLTAAARRHPELEIVWVDETIDGEDTPAIAELDADHEAFSRVRTPSLGDYLDDIARQRGVEPTPVTAPEPEAPPLLRRAMNRSFDVRPVLVYIPGMAVFGKLIDKVPKIPVKAILSLFALMLSFVAYCNYGIWKEYRDQIRPVQSHVSAARAHLDGEQTYEAALLAEAELNEASRKSARVILPYDTLFSIGYLHKLIEEHYETTNIEIKSIRDLEITPLLYRSRFAATVEADPQRMSLSHHPSVLVLAGGPAGEQTDPRGIMVGDRRLDSYRVPRSLDDYAGERLLAIHGDSAALLRVTLQEAMLAELDAGRLALEVDLSKRIAGRLEDHIYKTVRSAAGYTGEREALYSPDGITALLGEGRGTFYFSQLEASGVPTNLAKIRELLVRFPNCRAVVITYTAKARAQLAELAPEFTRVSIAEYPWSAALGYLRANTSPELTRAVMQDYHLRRSITDPLVLSLLVDYHRFAGAAPRSLALVYDRLLQNSLDRGDYGFAPKLRVLAPLAYELYATGDNLTRERATQLISELVFRGMNLDNARALLDEMVANGVLRYRSDTYVAFMDEAFEQVSVAKHLATLEPDQRIAFLLAHDERITAFYAGLFPSVDGLIAGLVAPYEEVDAVLRAAGMHLTHVNPYVHQLRLAAYAAQNGEPPPGRVTALETTLFELVEHHEVELVRGEARAALGSMSTESIRAWVLTGLDTSVAYDNRLTQFTATASEPVYEAPIERWLTRVGSDDDPRKNHRYDWRAIQDIDGNVIDSQKSGATDATQRAIYESLTTLAQIGTPHALDVVRAHATADSDPRFTDEVWFGVRRKAYGLLLEFGGPEDATAFLAQLEAAPAEWNSLIMNLSTSNDPTIAEALVRIITKPADYDRKKLEYKRTAAAALAVMDRDVAIPALDAALAAAPSTDASDFLPYIALSLGYRADPRDVSKVTSLAARVAAEHLPGYQTDNRAMAYVSTLSRALAVFGSSEAFERFAALYANAAWREYDETMFGYLANFPLGAAVQLDKRDLLCAEHDEATEGTLIWNLGGFGTDESRASLEELLRVVEGAGDVAATAAYCADQSAVAVEKLTRWRAGGWLPTFVGAVATAATDADIARFARWALNADREVRRIAVERLSRYSALGAGKALADHLAAYPDDYSRTLNALGKQQLAENEALVMPYLDDSTTQWNALLALRWVGGTRALLRIYADQASSKTPGNVKEAVFDIAERAIRTGVPHDEMMAAVRALVARGPATRRG